MTLKQDINNSHISHSNYAILLSEIIRHSPMAGVFFVRKNKKEVIAWDMRTQKD